MSNAGSGPMSVECPKCRALPGWKCRSQSGWWHKARVDLATSKRKALGNV